MGLQSAAPADETHNTGSTCDDTVDPRGAASRDDVLVTDTGLDPDLVPEIEGAGPRVVRA